MPINYSHYHPKWTLISRLVRYHRAKNQCEWCGAPNGQYIYRLQKGCTAWAIWPEGMQGEALGLDGHKPSRVTLTVAHIDRDRTNNRFSNLAALCNGCHLNHDRAAHAYSRRYGRQTKYQNGRLFE